MARLGLTGNAPEPPRRATDPKVNRSPSLQATTSPAALALALPAVESLKHVCAQSYSSGDVNDIEAAGTDRGGPPQR